MDVGWRDVIRNENVCKMVGEATMEDKLRETRLNYLVAYNESDNIMVSGDARGKGRPK